ncbi:zinc finger BED domain-containing protein RICESLEEPER 3-like [Gossypium raimondii]|uniref:zinc finger BED domain-containing protein RICESLEEPER 3-like n=1 Tax=Gossypium raimondii TaxID=29730 RepID=UPI00227B656C|nr:zinc finger BED domain-containing protein RICESLEEPER 3-like [Gossypium raimondii]
MIVIDELPFKFVESEGFKKFMFVACPRFHIPSRTTMTRDVYQLYLDESVKIKQILRSSCSRVCLTTDTWTSLQRVNYLCITAHFIDNDWNLNKKILNFCPISSHKGESIGMVIEKCLLNWRIDTLFTVTIDNASSNDVAIGLKEMNKSVERVRGLLDMWNSNYLMLDTAQNFERAFERFEEQDTNFRVELERGEDPQLNSDIDFNVMAIKLKEKYDKYQGDIAKMNLLMFVACVLDPRQKLKYLEFALSEMSSSEKACEMMQKLKESLYELFDDYKSPLHSTCSQSSVPTHVSFGEPQQKMKRRMQAVYKKRKLEICGEDKTSELDKYLAEANEEFVEDFDILLWWKVNSLRFPTLSKIARDVLAILLTTVCLSP